MARFLQTADWQLGMTRHFLSPEAQGRFAQDRIGDIAREQGAQFVVVCGDVFESNHVERQTVVRALGNSGPPSPEEHGSHAGPGRPEVSDHHPHLQPGTLPAGGRSEPAADRRDVSVAGSQEK